MRTGSENGGLYFFNTPSSFSSKCQTLGNQSAVCFVSKSLWHTRLGHPSDQAVDMLHHDLNFTKDSQVSPCDICHKAKQTREPFPFSDHQTTSIGELIHLDPWILTNIKIVRSDNDTKFVNNKMYNLFNSLGIVYQTSYTYIPQQNRIAERKHRHLLPSSILDGKSPFEFVPNDDGRGFETPNDDGNVHPCTSNFDDGEGDFATSMGDNSSSEGNVPSSGLNT
ncbi:ribonuclease H-like domain-containing protein [Tanacetum coccineum]